MSKYSNLLNSNNLVGFDELVRAQAEYQTINLSLISLNVMAKMELTKAKEAYEDWYADKYVTMREELNPRTLSAQKWLSQKEIELHIRVRYKEDYKAHLLEMEYAEQKVALMRRLMESWERHSFTLGQISSNIRAEIRGSYTED